MNPSTRRLSALAFAAVTVAASGCTVANTGSGGYDPNTLRIVLPQEPPTLEPCEGSLTSTGIVTRSNITEPLAERDSNTGELLPLLATGWEQTSPTEWTFTLRDGVTFSNGAPFTSADVTEATGLNPLSAATALDSLRRRGKLVAAPREGLRRRYTLPTPDADEAAAPNIARALELARELIAALGGEDD